jgi:prophage antirepressor-like protein
VSEIQPFTFPTTGQQIRIVELDGEPWFIAADVAAALGYRDTHNAGRLLHEIEKGTHPVSTPGGDQRVSIVSEPGLYRLVMRSNRPDAVKFQMWIAHDVLPAIRLTGQYASPAVPAPRLELTRRELAQLIIEEADRADAAEARAAELEPAATAWQTLASGTGDYSVADAAKILSRDPAIGLGRDRLFTLLAQWGWTTRSRGDGRWRVQQVAVNAGRLSEIPSSHYHPRTGELVLDPPQVRVTVKGLQEIHRRLGGTAQLALELVAA